MTAVQRNYSTSLSFAHSGLLVKSISPRQVSEDSATGKTVLTVDAVDQDSPDVTRVRPDSRASALSCLTLSLPRVINVKFLLQPHQKYNIAPYEEIGFS